VAVPPAKSECPLANVNRLQKNFGLRNVNVYVQIIELGVLSCSLSTAACESSFSILKQVLSPHRMSMLHSRKADLMIISFERDIAGKINSDGELLRRIWNSGPEGRRRLQLY
jgi:hypothetical protein